MDSTSSAPTVKTPSTGAEFLKYLILKSNGLVSETHKTIANKEAVLKDSERCPPGPNAGKTGKMIHLCLFLKERFTCILSKLLPVF